MPVSTFQWTLARFPFSPAASDKACASSRVNTDWVRSRATTSPAKSGGVAPRMRMGIQMPAARSSRASSRQATAR